MPLGIQHCRQQHTPREAAKFPSGFSYFRSDTMQLAQEMPPLFSNGKTQGMGMGWGWWGEDSRCGLAEEINVLLIFFLQALLL